MANPINAITDYSNEGSSDRKQRALPNPNSSSNRDSATNIRAPTQTVPREQTDQISTHSVARSKNNFLNPEKRLNSRMLLFNSLQDTNPQRLQTHRQQNRNALLQTDRYFSRNSDLNNS